MTTPARVPRWWWLAAALALFVAAYSLRYVVLGARAYVPELAESFGARSGVLFVHTLFGPLALVLGLVNLLPAMRRRPRWAAHRLAGRVYLSSALLLGGAGLVLAPHAAGGTIARAGFLALAVITVAAPVVGWSRIRRGDVRAHREWMLRSYACIFGAVTLRIWLPILIIAHGGDFAPAYRWVAWLSWVPNLIWAEWIIRRGWRPAFTLPATLATGDAP
jgi:uncharacterized membrane protein YozB (DUF420 family)